MDKQRLSNILSAFKDARIAVFGDFFVDKALHIDRALDEPSVETGLTAYQVTNVDVQPGAAGTVVNNLRALGVGSIYAIGVIGQDGEGYELLKCLRKQNVDCTMLCQHEGWFTPTYIKPVFDFANSMEESNRLDIRNRSPLAHGMEDKLIEYLYAVIKSVDAIIVLDQRGLDDIGIITPKIIQALSDIAQNNREKWIYADSRADILSYKHVIVKCNHLEAKQAVNPNYGGPADEAMLESFARKLCENTRREVFVTWGERGIGVMAQGEFKMVPALKVEGTIDICGAGDSTTAGLVGSLCAGADFYESALIGNLAASVTIRQIGRTGTATQSDIINAYEEYIKGVQG